MMVIHKLAKFPTATKILVLQQGCDISGVWIPLRMGMILKIML
jgi:hypothetical protein